MPSNMPGCLGALLQRLGLVESAPPEPALPYRLRDNFLSPAESSFCHVLKIAVGDRLMICPKVSLSDLFYVRQPGKNVGYRNKIAQKHVDFVLCDPDTLEPCLAIELDDASHRRRDRRERDAFVDEVFAAAGLPLLRIRAQRSYDTQQLALQITQTMLMVGAVSESRPAETGDDVPMCPQCNVSMVRRTARRGPDRGKEFYGCPNFPECRETLSLAG